MDQRQGPRRVRPRRGHGVVFLRRREEDCELLRGRRPGFLHEAAAFYDNVTRNGIVVGSVTHDTWKSGVYYAGSNGKLDAMNVFGGAVDKTLTHDVLPHGKVRGASVASPVMFVGYAADWRDAM